MVNGITTSKFKIICNSSWVKMQLLATFVELKKSAVKSLPKGFEDTLPEEMPFQGGCCALVDGFGELLERRQVQIKPQIDYLTENAVVFEDGSILDNVDIILFATGYLPDYDIIDIHGITGKRTREFAHIL